MKKIFFTGGGTAGHVTPNLALIERFESLGWQVGYVGTKTGIEKQLTATLNIPFYHISSGKLRRYFDWQNFLDPFLVVWGIIQSVFLCLRHRPDIVFSKGGFVAVPLVVAAWLCRIPVISHESDITPGLANKLSFPFARYICVNFSETEAYLPGDKTRVTGSPVRKSLLDGNSVRGRTFLGFDETSPILMVIGGSLGARAINETLWASLDALLEKYCIVHLVGAGNATLDLQLNETKLARYRQFEYLSDEFGDVIAAADFAISRAGANALYELIILQLPHLLIPLTKAASRGDQLVNAEVFSENGCSMVLEEADLNVESLVAKLLQLEERQTEVKQAMAEYPRPDAVTEIQKLIEQVTS